MAAACDGYGAQMWFWPGEGRRQMKPGVGRYLAHEFALATLRCGDAQTARRVLADKRDEIVV